MEFPVEDVIARAATITGSRESVARFNEATDDAPGLEPLARTLIDVHERVVRWGRQDGLCYPHARRALFTAWRDEHPAYGDRITELEELLEEAQPVLWPFPSPLAGQAGKDQPEAPALSDRLPPVESLTPTLASTTAPSDSQPTIELRPEINITTPQPKVDVMVNPELKLPERMRRLVVKRDARGDISEVVER